MVRGLLPSCQISYCRMARGIATGDGLARLTLDDSIQVAPLSESRFTSARGVPVLDGRRILELKFRGYVPAVFRRLVDEFALTPEPASKYRLALSALLPPEPADILRTAHVFDACA
jgi:VTC domain-containing protein